MKYDYSLVDDEDSFVYVPEGVHSCRIAEVRQGLSRCGSERWSVRLEVLDGEHAGRTAAWDSLTWSERGVPRVKQVLAHLGFDVTGVLEIEPKDLVGQQADVQTTLTRWEDPVSGRRQERMSVPFSGWASLGAGRPLDPVGSQ